MTLHKSHVLAWGWLLAACFIAGVADVAKAQSSAEYFLGSMLHEACRGDDLARQGICLGYITGVIDGEQVGAYATLAALAPDLSHQERTELAKSMTSTRCVPSHISHGEFKDVVSEFLQHNPKQLNLPARGLVVEAITIAFPCG
ncbi:Rap1a/Tai family immunity protein [Ruegeria sp.]|uniref:Rap1a/Tai family immunity protein n=1 Tax=Ruegeria sp. TaxID=1879320 RepID=UPI00231DAB34|nr:Rap1a/Tai family immunity protein [Ruegeria sp.]MDA7963274.1 hypothetical protein [Ruegeria sp.]